MGETVCKAVVRMKLSVLFVIVCIVCNCLQLFVFLLLFLLLFVLFAIVCYCLYFL